MKRSFLTILCLAIVFILLFSSPAGAGSPKQGLSGTDKEIALFNLIEESKFVKAREIAEGLLSADNDSYTGNFAMGVITRRAEANLPKAFYYLKKAKSSYERRHGTKAADNSTWRWHLIILCELIRTAAEMELYEAQLEYLKAYDDAYIPRQTAYYAWPLMKLGRIEEAREKIKRALLESKNEEDRIVALNTLGSIEAELDNREESYRVFKEARARVGNKKGFVSVRRNLGSAALVLLKFDESEREYINSTSEGGAPGETSNPWQDLAYLYTSEGRFDEAVGAIRDMILWGLQREPYLDQQCGAGEEGSKALFFLACGYPGQSYLITKRLVDRPDRLGYTSEKKYRALGGICLLHLIATEDYIRVLKEKSVSAGWKERCKYGWTILSLKSERVFLISRIRCITISNRALGPTLIPCSFQGISVPEFLEPDLTAIIGRGLIKAEIGRIRGSYRYRSLAEPYLLLFEGELAFRWHNREMATKKFREAVERLPPAEKLLIARCYAIMGKMEDEGGDFGTALAFYQKAYKVYPAIFRHLDIRLPVTVTVRGEDSTLKRIKKYIARSPRFKIKAEGYAIEIELSGNRIWGCLLDSLGNRVFSTSTVRTGDERKDASSFLDEFHEKAFSASISASPADLNSLDGTNMEGDRMRGDIRNFFFQEKSSPK